ncbi:MAG TPA: hypothetical protein VKG24_08425 [Pseudolabrys sp.]|jgi:hypothetical protein|nr:hypothetical protein [Pseudolabrys sp.]
MRKLFGITIAVAFAIAVWCTFPTNAKQPYQATTIDPMGLMTTTTNLLPEVEYDQGTVFLPRGVHY